MASFVANATGTTAATATLVMPSGWNGGTNLGPRKLVIDCIVAAYQTTLGSSTGHLTIFRGISTEFQFYSALQLTANTSREIVIPIPNGGIVFQPVEPDFDAITIQVGGTSMAQVKITVIYHYE